MKSKDCRKLLLLSLLVTAHIIICDGRARREREKSSHIFPKVSEAAPVVQREQDIIYPWGIIGGGPAGLIAAGALLDAGVKPSEILIVDASHFKAGSIGSSYGCVESNTPIRRYLESFDAIKSFHSPETLKGLEKLKKMNIDKCCSLSLIAESLQTVSDYLRTKVVTEEATIERIERFKDHWKMYVNDKSWYCAKKVILANGSHPKTIDYLPKKIVPLFDCFNDEIREKSFSSEDVVAVFGNGHSAIYVMYHLLKKGVKKVINFYRTSLTDFNSFKYQHLSEDLTDELLKWLNTTILRDPPKNLVQVFNNRQNRTLYQDEITKVVYAIGFKRNYLPIKNEYADVSFNCKTGVISTNLFGIGIAYPEVLPDSFGRPEDQVSIPEFVKHIHNVLPGWLRR